MGNVLRGVAHTLEAITSECSEFNKAWKAPAGATDLPRRWEGRWRSRSNGREGALRCVLTYRGDGRIEAFFRAKYSRFLRACYRVSLEETSRSGATGVRGSADLGALAGGIYEYSGTLSEGEFRCTYRCKYDEGDFHLRTREG